VGEKPKWPYQGYRRGQREAAEALASTVRGGGVFALSAPTGFGKTAVIIHGLLAAGVERVAYLVRTRNEILPVIRELKRFGVEDYVFLYSARRMCPLMGGEGLPPEDFWENCRLLRLRGECSYYASLERVEPDMAASVVRSAETPFEATRLLAGLGICPFFALRLLVGQASFIVATYPYVFRPDIFETVLEPLSYEDLVLVVDEAHSLLEAQSLLEARLSLQDLEAAARELEEYGLPDEMRERLLELWRLARKQVGHSGEGLRRAPREKLLEVLGEPGLWEDAADEIRSAKLREALESGSSPRVRVALAKVASFAASLAQEGYGAYYYTERGRSGLTALPLEPCTVTREPLGRARAVVLSSGTLPPPRLLSEALCIERKRLTFYDVEVLHGPVYSHDTRVVIVAAELTSRYTARSPSLYQLYASYLLETYRATRLSVLAVYPSYEFMNSVVSALTGLARHEPLRNIVEEPGADIDPVLERLRQGRALLHAVAGGKLAEGVEFRSKNGKNLIGTVFVAGVPYPQPDDYLRDRLEALARRTRDPYLGRELYGQLAVTRVRQAIGRVQRTPSDTALIILGDVRYLRRSLREKLRLGYNAVAYSLYDYRSIVQKAAEKLGV
jgi:DNA excision repair protein ERCC-2